MEFFLFLVIVGFAAAFGISLSRAKGRTRDNRNRISELSFELTNTRTAFIRRIKDLEREVSELQAALKIGEPKEGPRAEAPAAATAHVPPPPVSAPPESPAATPTAPRAEAPAAATDPAST